MSNSFILMTAMPPTKGHLSLIEFASRISDSVAVVVCTQPEEPMVGERIRSLVSATNHLLETVIINFHESIPQEPENENDVAYWEMWKNLLESFGFREGDYIVASEPYGQTLAEAVGGVFMPFDLGRTVAPSKASRIREDINYYHDQILPEFLPYVQRKVTIFGAESVGKSTTSLVVGSYLKATHTPEWARPYLEAVGPELTVEKMQRIYLGQRALQDTAADVGNHLYTIQDTDLFSTLGYWEMWDKDSVPPNLLKDARGRKSDLYVILSSDIPLEKDPLRYGGDVRETSDQYWIDLCERENLPYVYITDTSNRWASASNAIEEFFHENPLSYLRSGKQYEKDV